MKIMKEINNKFAVGLSKVYGNPLLIYACIVFSLFGAFVSADVLNKMTFWSNAIQLVFCPLSVYVALLNHNHIKKIHKHLGIEEEKK